jgi:hypothetical protein
LPGKFLINRTTTSGIALIISGIAAAVLGYAAAVNYSQRCLVTPGGFPPCTDIYQIALLAPLYSLSAWLIVLGSLLAIVGAFFTTLGQSKRRTIGQASKIGQYPNQPN